MALVVEDGTGKSNAESYLSVADCDTYHTNMGNTGWAGDATVKEVALRKATKFLDNKFRLRWKGTRTNEDQALAWPRSNVEDIDGFYYDSDGIPQSLKDATAELAVRAITEDDGIYPDQENSAPVRSSSVTVGPISESISYVGGEPAGMTFTIVVKLVQDLIEASGKVYRG